MRTLLFLLLTCLTSLGAGYRIRDLPNTNSVSGPEMLELDDGSKSWRIYSTNLLKKVQPASRGLTNLVNAGLGVPGGVLWASSLDTWAFNAIFGTNSTALTDYHQLNFIGADTNLVVNLGIMDFNIGQALTNFQNGAVQRSTNVIAFSTDSATVSNNLDVLGTITADTVTATDFYPTNKLWSYILPPGSSTNGSPLARVLTAGAGIGLTETDGSNITVTATSTGISSGDAGCILYTDVNGNIEWRNPTKVVTLDESFNITFSASTALSGPSQSTTQGGISTETSNPGYSEWSDRIGFWRLGAYETNASSGAYMRWGISGGAPMASMRVRTNTWFLCEGVLESPTPGHETNVSITIGIADSASPVYTTPKNGILWIYRTDLSTNWMMVLKKAGNSTTNYVPSTITTNDWAVPRSWQKLEFYGSTNAMVWRMNGVNVFTNSDALGNNSNMPVGTNMAPFIYINALTVEGTAPTNVSYYIDRVRLHE